MATDMKRRLNWSIKMQEDHALRYYRDYWDGIEKIDEVDSQGKENEAMKRLDFSGIDKIIHTEMGSIHVAQRFRQMRNLENGLKEPDFSLRIETYNDKPTEYQKLKNAHTGIGSTPQVYGFGITPYGRQVAKNNGFKKFYLIDVARFLEVHLDKGIVNIMTKAPNGDGSKGAYFSIDELERHGCIMQMWPDVSTNSNDSMGASEQSGLSEYTD